MYDPDADLADLLRRPFFEPARYTDSEQEVLLLSDNEFRLHTFSLNGSMHNISINGVALACELAFRGDGDPNNYYAGLIVVYQDANHKMWAAPRFEFFDGRYTKL